MRNFLFASAVFFALLSFGSDADAGGNDIIKPLCTLVDIPALCAPLDEPDEEPNVQHEEE